MCTLKKTGLLILGIGLLATVAFALFMLKQGQEAILEASYYLHPEPLYDALSTCDRVQIFDFATESVLYETTDMEKIRWVCETITVDSTRLKSTVMSLDRYRLHFYKNTKLVVDLRMKGEMSFHWMHGPAGWGWDFGLTEESVRQIVPWLCSRAGRTVYELFPEKALSPAWKAREGEGRTL